MLIILILVLLLFAYLHRFLLSGRYQPPQRRLLDLRELMYQEIFCSTLIFQDKCTTLNNGIFLLPLNCRRRVLSLDSDFDVVPQVSRCHK